METEIKATKQKQGKIEADKNVDVEGLKKEEWDKQLPLIEELQKKGAETFFKERNLKEAFRSKPEITVCMDEGTAMMKEIKKGIFTWGDTGRLLAEDREEALEEAARVVIELGIGEITSHDGCGAAEIGWKWDNPKEKRKPKPEEVNKYAEDWRDDLAAKIKSMREEMGKEAKGVKVSHISAEEMVRPKEIHNASVIYYYGGEGGFNPGDAEDIPQGIVIGRGGLEKALGTEKAKEKSRRALLTGLSIIFGNHGLSEKFTEDKPCRLIAMGRDLEHAKELEEEARGFLKDNVNFDNGKIVTDKFVPEGL